MPSRQEVLEAMRVLSEEIIESLRILFCMIFSMTRAVQPEEQVSDAEMNPIHQLVTEVRNQKAKISELGKIITSRFLQNQAPNPGPRSMSPPSNGMTGFESWEEAEMEAAELDMLSGVHVIHSHGVGPSTSPQSSTPVIPSQAAPAVAPAAKSATRIAGIPLPGRQLPAQMEAAPTGQGSQQSSNNHGQIALTQAALEAWGNKNITWGRKHTGKTYVATYESDPGYNKWILARMDSLTGEMEDFANYVNTRQRLEEAAMRHVAN